MNQTPQAPQDYWRKCTTCKKHIGFGQKYWVCSVSTCNRVRTGLVFCDLRCFDAHVPVLNHKDAGAFERKAPSAQEFANSIQQNAKTPSSPSLPGSPKSPLVSTTHPLENEILVVVSKVKSYIRTRSGMNTSDAVMETLSDYVRTAADSAIENAKRSSRTTVMDRDIL